MKTYEHKIIDSSLGNIDFITLKSELLEVELVSYGAALYQVRYFKDGQWHRLLREPKTLEDFLSSPYYYGKTVGRTSGRLVVPSYQIDDQVYEVKPYNAPLTQLHGGKTGFSYRNFQIVSMHNEDQVTQVRLRYVSKDLEEDFPGELTLDVIYTLNRDELKITHEATTTKDTLCNITNHAYFNLDQSETVLDHQLHIKSSYYLDIDQNHLIKDVLPVKDTPFDFRQTKVIEEAMKPIKDNTFNGYDHCFLLDSNDHKEKVIELFGPKKSIGLQISTSYPSVVVFTHGLKKPHELIGVVKDGLHNAITLECQFEPGGIHHDMLHPAILRKGEVYFHHMTLKVYSKA